MVGLFHVVSPNLDVMILIASTVNISDNFLFKAFTLKCSLTIADKGHDNVDDAE